MAGILGTLIGGPTTDVVSAIGKTFDKLFTSDEERSKAHAVLEKIRQQPDILQAEINKIEAAHRSVFVAGWRPFIGWVCGMGLLWAFIGHPLFEWGVALEHMSVTPPKLPTDNMMQLVLALLGMGSLRTYEKVKGISK